MDLDTLKKELERNLRWLSERRDTILRKWEKESRMDLQNDADAAAIFAEWRQTITDIGTIDEFQEMQQNQPKFGAPGLVTAPGLPFNLKP